MADPIHLTVHEIELLRNLNSGFHEVPHGDPEWERLVAAGLVAMSQPPSPPIRLTALGSRYLTGRRPS